MVTQLIFVIAIIIIIVGYIKDKNASNSALTPVLYFIGACLLCALVIIEGVAKLANVVWVYIQ